MRHALLRRHRLERAHLEPRVLRERRDGAALREVARLRHRVLGEARATLEIGLIGQSLEELVDGERQLERQAGEQVTDLPNLSLVAGGDQQLHRGALKTSCRAAARAARSSKRRARAAHALPPPPTPRPGPPPPPRPAPNPLPSRARRGGGA